MEIAINLKLLIAFALIGMIPKSNYAQTYSGVVLDENDAPLMGVHFKDTLSKIVAYTDYNGRFNIDTELNTVFSLYLYGYEKRYIQLNNNADTIRLIQDSRLLEAVIISSERVRSVRSELNENVLDYMVTDAFVLLLCSMNRTRYLIVDFENKESITFSLDKLKAKSLAVDCFGNIHLLTPTKAHQIWVGNNTVEFVMEAPIDQFNSVLKPCLAAFDSTYVISAYTNHNQKYTLAIKGKGQQNYAPFHEVWDRESEIAAEKMYYDILSLYYTETDCTQNIIVNKMWDGDVKRLAHNYKIVPLIGFYDKVLSKEIAAQTFRIDNQLSLFDLTFDSIQVFNDHGILLSTEFMAFNDPEEILHDQKNNVFYARYINNGIYQIGKIDLAEKSIQTSLVLNEAPFAEHIQIHDDWIYFLAADPTFKKLYKIKL